MPAHFVFPWRHRPAAPPVESVEFNEGGMRVTPDVLLKVDDLRTYFTFGEGVVRAVDGVSFEVGRKLVYGALPWCSHRAVRARVEPHRRRVQGHPRPEDPGVAAAGAGAGAGAGTDANGGAGARTGVTARPGSGKAAGAGARHRAPAPRVSAAAAGGLSSATASHLIVNVRGLPRKCLSLTVNVPL